MSDSQTARCVSLLLHVLVEADGDTAVLHAGEKPVLLGPRGRWPLAKKALSTAAMRRLVRELLPRDEQEALASVGATHYDMPAPDDLPHEHFTVDAEVAEGGAVVKVLRFRVPEEDYVPHELFPETCPARATGLSTEGLSMPAASTLWHQAKDAA